MSKKVFEISKNVFHIIIIITFAVLLAVFFKPIYTSCGDCNYFLMSILVGFPFGISKMFLILPPPSYGISAAVGVLALDVIVGGIVGFLSLIVTLTVCVIRLVVSIFC